MQLTPFKLLQFQTLSQALDTLAELGACAQLMAGGTDLMVRMKQRLASPRHVISLQGINELRYIMDAGQEVRIGSGMKIAQLEKDPTVQRLFPAIAEAAGCIAGPQHRSMGTLGGNLALDTRCWYYNQSASWRASIAPCLKTSGKVCHMVPRSSSCRAIFSGDMAPLLIVCGAKVVLKSSGKERAIPLEELYLPDGQRYLDVAADEVITEVRIPKSDVRKARYYKFSQRDAVDFPVVGLALSMERGEDGSISEIKVCLNAVENRPLNLAGLESLVGRPANEEAAAYLDAMLAEQAHPTSRVGGTPPFKRRVLRSLLKVAWKEMTANTKQA